MSITLKMVTLFGAIALFYLTASANGATAVQVVDPSTVLGSKQYYVGVVQKVNWYRAAQICAARGMSLASIESATENKNLRDYLYTNDISTSQFWLSGNDLALKNEYTWLGTGNKLGFTQWATGQPSTNVNNRCIQINSSYTWATVSCATESYFICSKPVVPECGAYGTCIYTFNPYK